MTSSNGNIFRVTGPLCGEFTGPGEFPAQRPVTRSFDVFFDLRPNKRLSKQPRGLWFETPSWSLWHHCNAFWITFLVDVGWVKKKQRDNLNIWNTLMQYDCDIQLKFWRQEINAILLTMTKRRGGVRFSQALLVSLHRKSYWRRKRNHGSYVYIRELNNNTNQIRSAYTLRYVEVAYIT